MTRESYRVLTVRPERGESRLAAGLVSLVSKSAAGAAGLGLFASVVFALLGGGLGFLVGYLGTLMLKAIAEMLLTTVQIEVNTRPME